jgi:hypothetical protein
MSHDDNGIEIRKPVELTIDGRTYQITVRWQPAANLLLLAGLDPMLYDLGELRLDRLRPIRYESTDIVGIHRRARFVSIRDRADVM